MLLRFRFRLTGSVFVIRTDALLFIQLNILSVFKLMYFLMDKNVLRIEKRHETQHNYCFISTKICFGNYFAMDRTFNR